MILSCRKTVRNAAAESPPAASLIPGFAPLCLQLLQFHTQFHGPDREVILPFRMLRRLDAVLDPSGQKVLDRKKFLDKSEAT
jgi:hypothetical protein